MADAPGFDATQERLYQEAQHRVRAQVIHHALAILDPGLDLMGLTYREALDRLCAACMAEVQRLDAA